MTRTIFVAVLASFIVAACDRGAEEAAAPVAEARQPWAEFAAGVIDAYYARNPEDAVDAGLHQYDGQMSDFSQASIDEYAAWLDSVLESAASYTNLDGIEAFERDYLMTAFEGELFWIRETNLLSKNPLVYSGAGSISVYVDREYAPLDQRLAAYTAYIGQLPGKLEQMKQNLRPPLPAPYVEMGYRVLSGLVEYLSTTVPEIFAPVDDEQLQRQFRAANDAAIEAIQQSVGWLDGLKATATDDYALGEERFLRMLSATQGVDITLEDLKAAGQANLDANLEMLYEACAEFAPGASTEDCIARVGDNKPPEGAVGGARRQLPMLKKFVVDNNIVTIPGTEDALVDEAPPHRRFNFAYINIPGPFETGLPSTYYIAPPDPEWSEEDQLAYIAGETDLLATSVHEVWPGHFLQYLHSNRTENNVGQHFGTYTFSEGWAHYTEQMMVDAGLGDGDPEVRIGQLLNALLRNVRYMSAIGLHTEGMTIEESQQMFEEKAFQDFGNASQQAYRGTYDPGYLNYTLGKLMINKLRDDWTTGRGGREAWGRFHDQFLSYGVPPIPLVREQMLGPDYDGDLSLLPN
ncbi:MAG: DUF885 family protein [Woeseiaceae bacterium]|nr:DUF885 family protein [Woeseiaceae bacterium]NIP21759.1 DUF885 family protein [Woeseiaceae bacterium]NIS90844.1 DUF885 family protein [Woeseiaceae bacterium]